MMKLTCAGLLALLPLAVSGAETPNIRDLVRVPLERLDGRVVIEQNHDLIFDVQEMSVARRVNESFGGREVVEVDVVGRWRNKGLYRSEIIPTRMVVRSPQLQGPVRMRIFEARGHQLIRPSNHILGSWESTPFIRYRGVSANRSLLGVSVGELGPTILARTFWGLRAPGNGFSSRVVLPVIRLASRL
ncbi:MAG: hypothetical protein HYT79_00905 [Elusimicrobia bacterium]|nr:hypothetical protein [Elusimicrobiota bacterium]